MKDYTIMIIDDEYSVRKQYFEDLLAKEYENAPISFNIVSVEYGRDFYNELNNNIKRIDAFFIDARLNNFETGWGKEYDIEFNDVLGTIKSLYTDGIAPPIFILSKHWDDNDFLSRISKEFAIVHNLTQPSRFYNLSYISDCVNIAKRKKPNGQLDTSLILTERNYISTAIQNYRNIKYNSIEPIDAIVLVAIPDERKSVYKYLNLQVIDDKRLSKFGFSYQSTKWKDKNIVVVSQTTMGLTDAARATTAAVLAFSPKIVFMTGICAGKRDKTKLGDIVIAKDVFDYSIGKINESGFEYRPPHKSIKSYLEDYANNCVASNENMIYANIKENYNGSYPDYINEIHIAPMASGPWVVNNKNVFKEICDNICGNCLAVDMEAYAVALSAEQLNTPWMIIKSVQDFADGEKSENEKHIRPYATYSSTYLLFENISKIIDLID